MRVPFQVFAFRRPSGAITYYATEGQQAHEERSAALTAILESRSRASRPDHFGAVHPKHGIRLILS